MDIKKIIYSILVEIKKGQQEPTAADYNISSSEFADIVKIIKSEGYANNIGVVNADDKSIVWLNDAKITMKGLDYIEQNSFWAKTYKGLKEIRDWLKP